MTIEAPKKPRRRHILRKAAVTLAFVVLVSWIGSRLLRQNPDVAEVMTILQNNRSNRQAQIKGILEMGPRAYPGLAKLVEYRESALHASYRTNTWRSMHANLKKMLPDPNQPRQLHITAVQMLTELGPAFVRPLTTSICNLGDDPDPLTTINALSLLYWSVPDSPEAVARLNQYFSEPGGLSITFGPSPLDDEFWTRVPNSASNLAQWLRNPVGVNMAATALGAMGTNAAPAIPAFVTICNDGAVGPPVVLKTNLPFMPRTPPAASTFLNGNRTLALQALGKIGIASPEVLGAVNRRLTDTNEAVRFAALQAWVALKQPPGTNLDAFMVDLAARTNTPSTDIVRWLGRLGPVGRVALPWLRGLDSMEKIKVALPQLAAQPMVQFPQGMVAPPPPIEALHTAVIIAICQIDPDEITRYLPDLIQKLGKSPLVAELLSEAKSHSAEITAQLEPILKSQPTAAYVMLAFQPDDEVARNVMRAYMDNGTWGDRFNVANLWWKRTGDSSKLFAICREGFLPKNGQPVLLTPQSGTILRNMGEAARPLIPELQAALWHPNRGIREAAGRLLLKIAPEALPPVKWE